MLRRLLLAILVLSLLTVSPHTLEAAPQAPPVQAPDENDLMLAEPDFALVNLPTTLRLPRHRTSFRLTHRFLANLRQNSFTDNLDDLFGLDNGAIIGIEFRFAPIRRVQTIVYRNNLDKTFQFSAQYDAVRQGGQSPVSFSPIIAIEGTNNFRPGHDDSGTDEHSHGTGVGGQRSPAVGAVVSRMFGDRLAVYATPMWVHNSLHAASGNQDTFFVGMGARARIRSKVYVVGEVSPRVRGYAPGQAEFAFGFERRSGGHMFLLTFTNSLSSTFGQVARGGFPDTIYMGFNLGRKFF
jgi:Membrane bound beta barrel domain (DUF5777)